MTKKNPSRNCNNPLFVLWNERHQRELWYKTLEQDQQDKADEIKTEEYMNRADDEYARKRKSEQRPINLLRAFFGFPTK